MPRNLLSSVGVLGVHMFTMALVLSGSADIPCLSKTQPKKVSRSLPNSHFDLFKVIPVICSFCKTLCNLVSSSSLLLPKIRISSIWHSTPGRPERILLICRWKCSGTLLIPKGNLLKWYLPNGVMNVVRGLELSLIGTCQNPQLASTLLNITAPCT